MNPGAVTVQGNQLLGALPPREFEILKTDLEQINLSRGDVIYQPGEKIKHVYFPENCIVSMLKTFEDGASIESGIIGREGMTGAGIALLNETSSDEAYVQRSGRGLRMRTDKFRAAIERGSTFKNFVLNYLSSFYEQVAQAGACSNHHSLDKRLARLLLMYYDRTTDDEIYITQDLLARMLGVYRPTVTKAAIELKEKGLVSYNRGSIRIHNHKELEEVSCECYQVIKESFRHYLSLLELRSLNQRMERANRTMAVEMRRQREIFSETKNRADNLQRVVVSINGLRGFYAICPICHKIRDERGIWEEIGAFIQNRSDISLMQEICPFCAGKAKSASGIKYEREF